MIFFGVFIPKNPSVNAHDGIVEINQTFPIQSPIEIQIDVQKCRNNSRRINPNVSLHGKENTGNPQGCRNHFQYNLKGIVRLIRFYQKIDQFVHKQKKSPDVPGLTIGEILNLLT